METLRRGLTRLAGLCERANAIAPGIGVGYDKLDVPALTRRRIPLATIGDVNAVPVAEQTTALLLGLGKRLIAYDRESRNGGWRIRISLACAENVLGIFDGTFDRSRVVNPEVL